MEATQNLNDKYVIGRGAHGIVYKAILGPGKAYAVKKLVFVGIKDGSTSMVREIQTIGKVRHRNLVKLEDFWLRKDYGLILYNYMENGSLHDILHETNPPVTLEWSVRYRIALGTAQGLSYLHFDCDPAIVHRDIKPMNILLDSDLEPHISDFGIAKLLDQSATISPSNTLQGTVGYMAPGIFLIFIFSHTAFQFVLSLDTSLSVENNISMSCLFCRRLHLQLQRARIQMFIVMVLFCWNL